MKLKLLILSFVICHFAFSSAIAQNSRVTQLQNAKNLTITTTDNHTYYYLVTSARSHTMHRGGGKVIIQSDTFNVAKIRGMRFISLPRFSLNEDSTAISADYTIDHGLLALRRSMNLNTWNSLVLPFSLTGQQVRETFGDDVMLAQARGVSEGDVATIEFNTIPLNDDEVVLEAESYYLIRPTREPDLPRGEMTSVVYGSGRINGPVYLIPNVTLNSGLKMPASQAFRSDDANVRVRFYGSYVSHDFTPETVTYLMNDEGYYAPLNDTQTLKAFRSWMEVLRNNNALPFRFYIDGVADITQGIDDLMASPSDESGSWYDLHGRVQSPSSLLSPSSTKRILIHNGKKILTR